MLILVFVEHRTFCYPVILKLMVNGATTATNAYQEIEEIFPKIIDLMPEKFDSHDFILTLAQQYQKLYIQALHEFKDENRPFQRVHMGIAKRLLKRHDLVEHVSDQFSKDIFGQDNEVAVWRKVKR